MTDEIILNPQIKLDFLIPPWEIPSTAHKHLATLSVRSWEASLHWLIKLEWRSNHKLPYPRKYSTALKPKGEFVRQLFLLCEKLHPLFSGNYENAWILFKAVLGEWVIQGCYEIFYYAGNDFQKGDKKEQALKPLHAQVTCARRLENPFLNTDMKLNAHLLDAAIGLCECSDLFRKKHYTPFITAWRNYIKSLDTPDFRRYFVEGDGLYRQGDKRSRIKIL